MTEPDRNGGQQQPAETSAPKRDMGLRSHLREIIGSGRTMSTVFFVLLVLIIIGGGCALLLR